MTGTLVLTRRGEDAVHLLPAARGDVRVEEWRTALDADDVPGGWSRIVLDVAPSDVPSAGSRALELLADVGDVVVPLGIAEPLTASLVPLRPVGYESSGERMMVVFGGGQAVVGDWSWSALRELADEGARSREREASVRRLLREALDREAAMLQVLQEHGEAGRARLSLRHRVAGLRRFAVSGRWWVRQVVMSRRRARAS